jgi:hypothetical protein
MGGQRLAPRQPFADPGSTLKTVPDRKLFSQLAMFLINQFRPFALLTEYGVMRSSIIAYLRRPDGLLMPLAKMWCSGIWVHSGG